MKMILLSVAFLASALFYSEAVYAVPFTVQDTVMFGLKTSTGDPDITGFGGKYLNKLEASSKADYVKWQHAVDPTDDNFLSATLTLFLSDDKDKDKEYAILNIENGKATKWLLTKNMYQFDVSSESLADGKLDLYLGVLKLQDFYIEKAILDITYDHVTIPPELISVNAPQEVDGGINEIPGTAPVPEPGMILLLAAGLLGLGLCRKIKMI